MEAYLHKVLKDGVAGNNARNDEMSENARVGHLSLTLPISHSVQPCFLAVCGWVGFFCVCGFCFFVFTLCCPNGNFFPMGNSGRFSQGKPAATESHYPTLEEFCSEQCLGLDVIETSTLAFCVCVCALALL